MDELLDEAHATAEVAATVAGVTVSEVTAPIQARAVSSLFDEVWGQAGEAGAVLTGASLTAMAHAGNQISAAWRDGELVAATAAFLGRDHGSGTLYVHSHVTGVRPGSQGAGIGRALKWHQRAWCLERGIDEVRWTYDPLVRRNAVLNLVVLGAQATHYEIDRYGPMDDARNVGLPTDRIVVSWPLGAPRTLAAAKGRAAAPDADALRRAGAQPLVSVGDDDQPVLTTGDAPRALVQVPADIELLRTRDRDLAAAWSDAIRSTLGEAMRAGARVSGVTRDGWYVLAAVTGVTELADRR